MSSGSWWPVLKSTEKARQKVIARGGTVPGLALHHYTLSTRHVPGIPCVQYTFTRWRKDSFSPASSVISERFKTSTLMADKCPSRQGRERERLRGEGEIEKIWLKLEHCYQPLCLTSSCSGVLRATSIQGSARWWMCFLWAQAIYLLTPAVSRLTKSFNKFSLPSTK